MMPSKLSTSNNAKSLLPSSQQPKKLSSAKHTVTAFTLSIWLLNLLNQLQMTSLRKATSVLFLSTKINRIFFRKGKNSIATFCPKKIQIWFFANNSSGNY